MKTELMRELFEAAMKKHVQFDFELNSGKHSKDTYFFQETENAYLGFQAACNMFLPFVEILPDDAEPQVGDLLQSTKGSMGGVSCGYLTSKTWHPEQYGGQPDKDYWTITPRFGDGSKVNKHWANPKEWQKIIQRNGKYAIRESELKQGEK